MRIVNTVSQLEAVLANLVIKGCFLPSLRRAGRSSRKLTSSSCSAFWLLPAPTSPKLKRPGGGGGGGGGGAPVAASMSVVGRVEYFRKYT